MKKLLAFVFIITSVFAYAQDSTKTKKVSRFFIGINFSPDYCFRTLKNNDGSSLSSELISIYNKVETAKFGFSTGINFCYLITTHISIDLGAQYSNKGFQEKDAELTFGSAIDRRRGFVYNTNNSSVTGKIVYAYNYLDIPLKVNFVFGKKKVRFISSLGLTTNLLINSKNIFIGKDNTGKSIENSSSTTSTYNRINLSPNVSCGIDYKVNNKMFFRIEPTFRYGILKMTDTPVTQYLWNAGLNISYYFGL
ncbi:MAG TPA: outer membrane beta-barrel protein [Bacteroidia bacterium]|jgi:hypothetical protein|nr:outer membrane beta-barrel protein [Bacteroidia bacterium]